MREWLVKYPICVRHLELARYEFKFELVLEVNPSRGPHSMNVGSVGAQLGISHKLIFYVFT